MCDEKLSVLKKIMKQEFYVERFENNNNASIVLNYNPEDGENVSIGFNAADPNHKYGDLFLCSVNI
jgi:hypothetical protein